LYRFTFYLHAQHYHVFVGIDWSDVQNPTWHDPNYGLIGMPFKPLVKEPIFSELTDAANYYWDTMHLDFVYLIDEVWMLDDAM